MAYTHIEVQPLSGRCGAENYGIGLSQPIRNAAFWEAHDALIEQQLPVGAQLFPPKAAKQRPVRCF